MDRTARGAALARPAASTVLVGGACAVAAGSAVLLGPAALALPVAVIAALHLVRHPAQLYGVYLYVGIFKSESVLASLPFDITFALGALLVGVCFHRLLTDRARNVPLAFLAPYLLIGALMAISLSWTDVPSYGDEKVLKFFTITLVAAFAPFFVVERRRDVLELLWTVVGLAGVAALLTIANPPTAAAGNEGRRTFGGIHNTIFVSRTLCTGGLVLLLAPGLRPPGGRLRLLAPLTGLAMIGVAATIGSRGPLISLAFALGCVTAASVLRSPRQLVPVLAAIALAAAAFPFISLPETSRQRLAGVTRDPVGTLQGDGRDAIYRQALELTGQHPVRGIGTGGFFLYSYVVQDQEEKYPHNIFLELATETGIPSALLLLGSVLALLAAVFRRAWATEDPLDRHLTYLIVGILLFNLFAVQFSGDINDNRAFWAWSGLAWLIARHGLGAGRQAALAPR